jgi:subtilisin family serine protease
MRRIPNKTLKTIILVIIIVILIGVLIYIYPLLIQEIPPKRSEWAYREVQVTKLNDLGLKGNGVIVGIIDTGIDLSHPELKHVNIIAWRDLINGEVEPYDDDGHGTAMAGIIAGKTYGIAPDASLIVVKAIHKSKGASDSDILSAIRYCMNEGADIISMSLGRDEMRIDDLKSPWQNSNLEDACDEAVQKGIFLVAAAGNDGKDDDGEVSVPGVYDKAITVGAVDENLKIASFSSMGDNDGKLQNIFIKWDPWEREDPDKKPEVVAPGVDIVTPGLDGKYYKLTGTSLAVPFVAGGLALILGDLPQYQRENNSGEEDINKVKTKLMSTSKRLDNQEAPHDDWYGYGLFQAYDLYDALNN